MNWNLVISQLERILAIPLQSSVLSLTDWTSLNSSTSGREKKWVESEAAVHYFLQKEANGVRILSIPRGKVSSSEKLLVDMTLDAYRAQHKKSPISALNEEERKIVSVKEWLERQLEQGISSLEMPDTLASPFSLFSSRIPLLLYGENANYRNMDYHEFKKILQSFFETEVVLIPLKDKEWVILGSDQLLDASLAGDKETDAEYRVEDALTSIAEGLHEMMLSEAIGECHVAIAHSIVPAKSLLSTVNLLRESVMLGRTYRVHQFIHLPWALHLEKLLYAVGDIHKTQFLQNVLKGIDHLLDSETLTTLEYFFELDCNVSETAKTLYIHRNTLLYRLDKFKQETGLDVRTFNDAVLVKLALLLYKVTKRK